MKKLIHTLFTIILTAQLAYTQIGINQTEPHTTAVLELQANSTAKGLLIPRITTSQRKSIDNPASGLLVFDTNYNKFFFYHDKIGSWVFLDPWTCKESENKAYIISKNVGIGTKNPTVRLEVKGKIKADNLEVTYHTDAQKVVVEEATTHDIDVTGTITAKSLEGYGIIPKDGIIMWSGDPKKEIPDGFALCDGKNGTPNLTGRFIIGDDPEDIDFNMNEEGGSKSKKHSHSLGFLLKVEGLTDVTNVGESTIIYRELKGNDSYKYKIPLVNHKHNYSVDLEYEETDKNETSIDCRPPYYVLAYIMRIK